MLARVLPGKPDFLRLSGIRSPLAHASPSPLPLSNLQGPVTGVFLSILRILFNTSN